MAFFASTKPHKRKRTDSAVSNVPSKSGKFQKRVGPLKSKRREEDTVSEGSQDDAAGFGLDDLDLRRQDEDAGSSAEEDEEETPAEKRLRLARLYLESVKHDLAQEDGAYDAADIDRDLISARLKRDVLQQSGRVHDFVASSIDSDQSNLNFLRVKGHRLPITCGVASRDATFLYTSGKEGSIIKWDLASGKQLVCFPKVRVGSPSLDRKGKREKKDLVTETKGHTDEVLCLALSDDGELLASGGRDRLLGVWEAKTGKWLRGFGGHKDAITAVAFRKESSQLFTASLDRTIKLWDLSVLAYVETLFGHQDSITGLDVLRAETAVSTGGRDKTVRFWKVADESQLVFRGGGKSKMREILEGGMEDTEADGDAKRDHQNGYSGGFIEGSLDCVALVDESTFLSGGDSGSICLWNITKKKPLYISHLAHGVNTVISETEGSIRTPRWIMSLATLRYSDLFASGSWDGEIHLWRLESDLRSFSHLATIGAPGFVNSLQIIAPPAATLRRSTWTPDQLMADGHASDEEKLRSIVIIAGMGQEPRTGRWMRLKGPDAQNACLVIPLRLASKIPS